MSTPPASPAERRYKAIVSGTLSGVLGRSLTIGAGFVIVPLTVGYMGPERYGAWIAISAFVGWLQLSDGGMSNSLTNSLVNALSRDDRHEARVLVSSGMAFLACAGVLLVAIALVGSRLLTGSHLLGVYDPLLAKEVNESLLYAVLLVACALPLGVTDRVLYALQQPHYPNGWNALSSVLSLVAVYGATRAQWGLPGLVVAMLGTRTLVSLGGSCWLFMRHMPGLRPTSTALSIRAARELVRSGAGFLLIQVSALVLYSTDSIILSRALGPATVASYSVAWKLFSIPAIGMSLVFPYLWPAYADAIARRDTQWVKATLKRTLLWTVGGSTTLVIIMVPSARYAIRHWAGADIAPDQVVVAWMAAWAVLSSFVNALVCPINASGRIANQARYGVVMAIANIGLSIWWVRLYGASGVIAATVVCFALFTVPRCVIDARRLVT